jgi:hypothetical protein
MAAADLGEGGLIAMTTKISKDLWERNKRHGYASVSNGQRYILCLDTKTGATVLQPVEIEGMPKKQDPR